MERSGWVVGVIVIVLILSFLLFYSNEYGDDSSEAIAEVPQIDLEATVVSVIDEERITMRIDSLSPEEYIPTEDCVVGSEIYDEPIVYPAPEEGLEVTADFYYKTEPVIKRYVPVNKEEQKESTEGMVEEEVVDHAPELQKEEGQWVLTIEDPSIDEIQEEEFLPGLSEGDVFRATVPVTNLCTYRAIGEYSIISE